MSPLRHRALAVLAVVGLAGLPACGKQDVKREAGKAGNKVEQKANQAKRKAEQAKQKAEQAKQKARRKAEEAKKKAGG
jgi:hypothetical protein